MTARPTEVKAFVAMLEDEHEDVETLAKALITELDRMRAERPFHVAVVKDGPHAPLYGVGPFPTQAKAVKFLETGQYATHPAVQAMPLFVMTPEHLEARREATDTPPVKRTVDQLPAKRGR